MKRHCKSAALIVSAAFILTSCGKSSSNTFEVSTEETTVSAEETTETTTAAVNMISGEAALADPESVGVDEIIDVSNLTPDDIAHIFYYNSCFIGDSIIAGFGYFAAYPESPEFMNNINFLAATNFSTVHALAPIDDEDAIHPIFRGEKTTIFDGVEITQPKRVFIGLGMNEIAGNGAIDRTTGRMSEIIYRIKQLSPGCEVYVLSAAPMTKDNETDYFNNSVVRTYNDELKKYVGAWGAHYVDVASVLTAEDGCLPYSYSSDGALHMTNETYLIWANYLKNYAVKHINGNYGDEPEGSASADASVSGAAVK